MLMMNTCSIISLVDLSLAYMRMAKANEKLVVLRATEAPTAVLRDAVDDQAQNVADFTAMYLFAEPGVREEFGAMHRQPW